MEKKEKYGIYVVQWVWITLQLILPLKKQKATSFPFCLYFLFKINENDFSLFKLENGFAFGPNLENLACLKNSIREC